LNPIVHGELAWLVAQKLKSRRDRWLVTAAGLAPDLDGLTILVSEDAYGRWHHLLTHGFISAGVICGLLAVAANERLRVLALALVAFHLHLVCDLAGSGLGWPIYYFVPFSEMPFEWSGGWELASWQNSTIGMAATLVCLACALPFGRTVVELFSLKADAAVVKTIRARFGRQPMGAAIKAERD
jgi:inner membrane protein